MRQNDGARPMPERCALNRRANRCGIMLNEANDERGDGVENKVCLNVALLECVERCAR
jgi:hypothetical protein